MLLEVTRRFSGGVHVAHAEPDATLPIDLKHFDANDIALGKLVADFFYSLFGDLRNMYQPVLARKDGHERAEVHQPNNLAEGVGSRKLDAG